MFLDFREPFLIYGDYCASMTSAVDTLTTVCKRNPQIEQCMEQSQKEHSGGKNQLRDILSVPMQRILKYHLLLGKLVEETSPVSKMGKLILVGTSKLMCIFYAFYLDT